ENSKTSAGSKVMMSSICLAVTRVSFGVSARTGSPSLPRLSTPAANSSFASLITVFSLLVAAFEAASQRRRPCDPLDQHRPLSLLPKVLQETLRQAIEHRAKAV